MAWSAVLDSDSEPQTEELEAPPGPALPTDQRGRCLPRDVDHSVPSPQDEIMRL